MYGDLEILDEMYSRLYKREDLVKLLGSPQTPLERNEKIRREITPVKLVTADKLNFIGMYFSSATETDNVYVARGFLNVDYYAKSREDLRKIQSIVKDVFEENYLLRVSFRNEESYTKGIFCYVERYRPLVYA
ncbi:MAG: hypothetical protein IJ668_04575 [Selenomonadaceae bacterium]|nr:hypothetical protein [Selenomonadaceae bacterium]